VSRVISGQLKSVSESSVRLVRVYSETIQCDEFLVPGHVTTSKTADRSRDMSLQSVSLHHLIRQGDSATAAFIRSIDRRRRRRYHHDNDDDEDDDDDDGDGFLTSEQLELYHAAIKEREKELLMTADVILCTCVMSGDCRVSSWTNIQQVC